MKEDSKGIDRVKIFNDFQSDVEFCSSSWRENAIDLFWCEVSKLGFKLVLVESSKFLPEVDGTYRI